MMDNVQNVGHDYGHVPGGPQITPKYMSLLMLQVPALWYEAIYILKTHKHYVPLFKM